MLRSLSSVGARALVFSITLCMFATVAVAQPANDDCASAIPVVAGTPVSGETLTATDDGDGSCGLSTDSPDVWYSYTAVDDVVLTASLCDPGTDYDTVLSIHSGCPGDQTNQLICDDDDADCTNSGVDPTTRASTATVQLAAGDSTLIRVTGFNGAVGNFTLNLSEAPVLDPPANDSCADAHPVGPGTYFGNTEFATNDGDASCPTDSSSPDVWYSYTPTADGLLTAATCNAATDFDTALSVHTGCPGDQLNEVACDDDEPLCPFSTLQSQVVDVPVTAGTEYLIRVHSFLGATGNYGLLVNGPAADGFALSYSGSCPGPVTIDASGLTPDGPVAFLIDNGTGNFAVPAGGCSGTETDISGNLVVSPIFLSADGAGDSGIAGNAPAPACGAVVQAVDLTTCDVSALTSVD